jgi:hypothetical protein
MIAVEAQSARAGRPDARLLSHRRASSENVAEPHVAPGALSLLRVAHNPTAATASTLTRSSRALASRRGPGEVEPRPRTPDQITATEQVPAPFGASVPWFRLNSAAPEAQERRSREPRGRRHWALGRAYSRPKSRRAVRSSSRRSRRASRASWDGTVRRAGTARAPGCAPAGRRCRAHVPSAGAPGGRWKARPRQVGHRVQGRPSRSSAGTLPPATAATSAT